jgi:hypothetical protein
VELRTRRPPHGSRAGAEQPVHLRVVFRARESSERAAAHVREDLLVGGAHGGTGWAVELARHWGKPVHLFDQERKRWYERDWVEAQPAITRERFAGAGTRSLSDDGRAAIRALFERSFGAPRS